MYRWYNSWHIYSLSYFQLVFTEGDSTFGYPDPARKVLYTAEHNINKLEFYNDELVLASSNSTVSVCRCILLKIEKGYHSNGLPEVFKGF